MRYIIIGNIKTWYDKTTGINHYSIHVRVFNYEGICILNVKRNYIEGFDYDDTIRYLIKVHNSKLESKLYYFHYGLKNNVFKDIVSWKVSKRNLKF